LNTAIIEKIQQLKVQRNAVILAHNYQSGEIQDIADYTGDSLGLSVRAASTEAEVIVFCGVLFMAETAAILSPDKTVLLPEKNAGCPMADMITGSQFEELKAKHPDAITVCYVNTPADVKAHCDYCCTSGNAVELVNTLPKNKQIIFVPDKYLGRYVAEKTGRNMILWPGYCPTHARISAEQVEHLKVAHPEAVAIAHPECNEQVAHVADEILSTGQMLKFVKASDAKTFIVATELGIIHTLKKENPDKEFIPVAANIICTNMKKITLEKVLWSLEDMQYEITVSNEIALRAKGALDRMLEVLP